MGHGPTAYKSYQEVFAAGMLFIMLTGLWLGTIFCPAPLFYRGDLGRRSAPVLLACAFVAKQP